VSLLCVQFDSFFVCEKTLSAVIVLTLNRVGAYVCKIIQCLFINVVRWVQ